MIVSSLRLHGGNREKFSSDPNLAILEMSCMDWPSANRQDLVNIEISSDGVSGSTKLTSLL